MPYIYALVDVVTLQVRYIGKTKKSIEKRLVEHLISARGNKQSHKVNWIRKCKGRIVVQLIEEVSSTKLDQAEQKWIKYYRDRGYPLTNETDGGEGLTNPSKEVRKAISRGRRLWLKTHLNPMKGKRHKKATKKLISKKKKLWYKTHVWIPKKHTQATKMKSSRSRKLWLKTHNHQWLGRHHTTRAKKAIGLASRERQRKL